MHRSDVPTEPVLRRQMVDLAHRLHRAGLLVALDGNLSVRLPDGNILCTRAGCHKGLLTEDDLVVTDATGRWRSGLGRPTSELGTHLACYEERPDTLAVVHAHPPAAIACTVAGLTLDAPILPEVVLTLGTVPTVAYATTGSAELAEAIRPAVRYRDAILLDRHGAITLGRDPLEAFGRMETVEHMARVVLDAARFGPVQPLPWEEAVALRRAGLARYGGPPASVEHADDPDADLRWARLPRYGARP